MLWLAIAEIYGSDEQEIELGSSICGSVLVALCHVQTCDAMRSRGWIASSHACEALVVGLWQANGHSVKH